MAYQTVLSPLAVHRLSPSDRHHPSCSRKISANHGNCTWKSSRGHLLRMGRNGVDSGGEKSAKRHSERKVKEIGAGHRTRAGEAGLKTRRLDGAKRDFYETFESRSFPRPAMPFSTSLLPSPCASRPTSIDHKNVFRNVSRRQGEVGESISCYQVVCRVY